MRPAIPTELLLRLINATPEQYAAVERILGCAPHPACGHLHPSAEKEAPVSEDVARSAFALLQKLELDPPLKAPSVLTVFRLYCVDGHSADRVPENDGCLPRLRRKQCGGHPQILPTNQPAQGH